MEGGSHLSKIVQVYIDALAIADFDAKLHAICGAVSKFDLHNGHMEWN